MTKILVTGSEGLIGKDIVDKFQKKGFEVIEFDIINGFDVLDLSSLKNSVKDADGVIHLAAATRVVTGYKDPYNAVQKNIIGTTNVLESIREINPKCWMIYASSREVYGEGGTNVKESDPINPINVYGATKAGAELITLTYGSNYNLNTFVVRFSNVYGAINDHKDRVIPRFVKQALTNSDITVYGGKQKFDFVHLHDVTDGLIVLVEKIIEGQKLLHRTFHFVSGQATTLMELVEQLIKITNSKSTIKYFPERTYDVNTFVGDPTRTQEILGWNTKISLEKGLSMYVDLIKI